ncbi:uncharacterized protein LOC129942325 [Eupeodes corollae]|uniref:uncharacterized protein LOC129942325 n=1 Tax=Eupeodes corollae TaxID=290404 RepID=UPI00248FDBA0|nr:uncharacterized protein LOC129942325 [Eupeodes corollae]
MSFLQSLYKKFNKSFYNEHILSVKAFLAKTAIEILFHNYKVTRFTKCLPTKYKKNQTNPSNTTTGGAAEKTLTNNIGAPPIFKIKLSPNYFGKSSLDFYSANPAVCDRLRMLPQPENRHNDFKFFDRGEAMKLVNGKFWEDSIKVQVLDCNSNTPPKVCHLRQTGAPIDFSRLVSASGSASESPTGAIYKLGHNRTTNLIFLPKVIDEGNFCGMKWYLWNTESSEAYNIGFKRKFNGSCLNQFEEMVTSNSMIHPCFYKNPENGIIVYGNKTFLLKSCKAKTWKKNNLIMLLPSGQIFEVIDFPKEDFQELLVNRTFCP